jgi:Na+/melibiose symporter-like transporter
MASAAPLPIDSADGSELRSATGAVLGPAYYLDLSVFWFASSFLWSGLITFVIQGMVEKFDPLRKDLNLGVTLALGALISTLVCYYIGAHSDRARFGLAMKLGRRRPYILIGTICTIPFLLALPWASSLLLLVLVVCGIQFFSNIATAPYQAMIPDLVPKARQGAASAWMGLSALLGTSVGVVAYSLLIKGESGLLKAMLCVSSVLIATAAWTVLRVREVLPDSTQVLGKAEKFDWRLALQENPSFFWLIGSRFFINLGFYTATGFLLYYFQDTLRAADPETQVRNFSLIGVVSGLVGNFPAGWASDRISKKRVAWISLALLAAASLGFLLAGTISLAMISAVFFGVGWGAFAAVDWALATNLLPPRDQARWMGIWHGAFTVPQVVAPLIGGVVAYNVNQAFGQGAGYRATLAMVLLYLAIGALMIVPIREHIASTFKGKVETA